MSDSDSKVIADIRGHFASLLKKHPLWNKETVELNLSNEEILKRYNEVTGKKDIPTIIPVLFINELTLHLSLKGEMFRPVKRKIAQMFKEYGIAVSKNDICEFQKLIDKAGPLLMEVSNGKEQCEAYASYVAKSRRDLHPELADLSFFAAVGLYKMSKEAKHVREQMTRLEHEVFTLVTLAQMALFVPRECVMQMAKQMKMAYYIGLQSANSIIVMRPNDVDPKIVDQAFIEYIREKDHSKWEY